MSKRKGPVDTVPDDYLREEYFAGLQRAFGWAPMWQYPEFDPIIQQLQALGQDGSRPLEERWEEAQKIMDKVRARYRVLKAEQDEYNKRWAEADAKRDRELQERRKRESEERQREREKEASGSGRRRKTRKASRKSRKTRSRRH